MRSSNAGLILIVLGLLFLLDNMGYIDFGDIMSTYWPLILVLVGIRIILRHNRDESGRDSAKSAGQSKSSGINDSDYSNVMGDVRMNFANKEISYQTVNNIFGDIDLDFSESKLLADASVKVSAIFGTIHIKLPKNTKADIEGSNIAGDIQIFQQTESGFFKNIRHGDKSVGSVRFKVSVIFGDIHVTD